MHLLPCPFCAAPPLPPRLSSPPHAADWWEIHCSGFGCGAVMGSVSPEHAAQLWNQRIGRLATARVPHASATPPDHWI